MSSTSIARLLVTIAEEHGPTRQLEFDKNEVTIGRVPVNDIVLSKGDVSKTHSRLFIKDGQVFVADMKSTNGTYVNAVKIVGPQQLQAGDCVRVGDYTLTVEVAHPQAGEQTSKASNGALLQKELHHRLIQHLDLRRMDVNGLASDELRRRTSQAIRDLIDQMDSRGDLPTELNREDLVADVLNEALGLGPLEALLKNDEISEVMVNHARQIYIEVNGKIQISDKVFSSDRAVLGVIERIVAPIGRRIDESSPLVDARLQDGSRVNAIIPPLALKGPCITIRKFKRDGLRIEDLTRYNTLTQPMAEFLHVCVKERQNIIISGGTGSGKTTTLNVISSFIPRSERIITVEDAAELQLPQEHWIQLETRPPNLEGKGAITIRELVKNTLRMRPDRIVVGECRSGEALDMLQAMNTGHDGSLTTLHANTPRDALSRLETMVLMAGMDLPIRAIREQIASAVDIIVQQTRFSDGSRKICNITEVTGMESDIIALQDIFYFKQEGVGEGGKIQGRFLPSGFIPRFYEGLRSRGTPVETQIFR